MLFTIGHSVSAEIRKKISNSNKGKTMSEEARNKMSKSHLGKKWSEEHRIKMIKIMTGRKVSEETRRKIGESNKLSLKGRVMPREVRLKISKNHKINKETNHLWKGGITKELIASRYCFEGREWRKTVLERDNYTCINCGYKHNKPRDIRVDHIKPFWLYPKLRYDINNGRTLCVECDKKIGWSLFREQNPRKRI